MSGSAGRSGAYGRRATVAVVALAWLAGACGQADDSQPGETWPRTVTVHTYNFGHVGDGVRLADGEIVETGGDVSVLLGVQLSLQREPNATGDIFCFQGTFDSLSGVPVDQQRCAGDGIGEWRRALFLSASVVHESQASDAIGYGGLVRSREGALYRLRVLGDSVALNAEGVLGVANATFEYEPVL